MVKLVSCRSTVYAAPTLKPDGEEEPSIPLQPHPAERALPRMLLRRT